MLRVRYRRVPLFLTSYRYNHYKTLGVDRHATQEELKKSHKALARKYHPDRPTGDEAKFVKAQEAYSILSDSITRKDYDESIFGVEKEAYKQNDEKFMAQGVPKRAPGEAFVSGQYEEANNQFDRFERSLKNKIFLAKSLLDNPFQNLAKLLIICTVIYGIDRGVRNWLAWLCSEYLYEENERLIELPGTEGYKAKQEYIEKIISEVPENPQDQYAEYGIRKDWLIEFYMNATRAQLRGELPTLQTALRYLPFVGMDFLKGEIPLNPADDFHDGSAKCVICQFIYGNISKHYPAEFLEQHSTRCAEFLRSFLPSKTIDMQYTTLKVDNPDYIEPATGEKNIDGRQLRHNPLTNEYDYGEKIQNREVFYGDVNYEMHRRKRDLKNY